MRDDSHTSFFTSKCHTQAYNQCPLMESDFKVAEDRCIRMREGSAANFTISDRNGDLTYVGNYVNTKLNFTLLSEGRQTVRSLNVFSIDSIQGVDNATVKYQQISGSLSFAPFSYQPSLADYNLMYQLKDGGTLDYNVVSIYGFKNLSSRFEAVIPILKFGSYDPRVIMNN